MIDLGYTIQGRGGVGLFWLDDAGQITWSALAGYNFDLLPGSSGEWQSTTVGSFLLSMPFSLASNDTLSVVADLFSAQAYPYYEVGFALLVTGMQLKAVLFACRPDGINHIADLGAVPGTVFAAPSPGVQTKITIGGPFKVILGGREYGHVVSPSDGKTSAIVTTSYVPGAGSYQILFGMFSVSGPLSVPESAMIVQFAGV